MTYKEIINRFRQVTSDHFMLQDFGYGELSDIKTQSQLGPEEQGADYPYLFLNPTSHTRTGPVMNYSFNMIVMDMARGEEGDVYDNYITIQSQCQQYIDDVLSQLYYGYQDKPEIQLTGITYTPFKEKYQDTLAGMTATITIQVPVPIDNCIAPYNLTPFVWVRQEDPQILGSDGGEPGTIRADINVINNASNPYGYWNINKIQTGDFDYPAKIELTYDLVLVNQEEGHLPLPFRIAATDADVTIGWPTEVDSEVHPVTQIWNNVNLSANREYFFGMPGGPVGPDMDVQLTNVNIKFFF